jgi:hypothetical protein
MQGCGESGDMAPLIRNYVSKYWLQYPRGRWDRSWGGSQSRSGCVCPYQCIQTQNVLL